MRSSEEIAEVAAALVAAQAEFTPAIKSSNNPFFGSKYADLGTAIEAAQPALLKNGIVVIQDPSTDVDKFCVHVTTRLIHKSGQWLEGTLTLPAKRSGKKDEREGGQAMIFDAQSVGSAITYGRRYGYMAMLGFAAEDDDGNAGSGRSQVKPQGSVQHQAKPELHQRLQQSVQAEPGARSDPFEGMDDSFLSDGEERPQDRQPRVDTPIGDKAKMLYAIAMKKKMTTGEYRDFIKQQGFAQDRDIPSTRLNEIKGKLEAR